MNRHIIFFFTLLSFLLASCHSEKQNSSLEMPLPTNGETIVKLDMENPEKSNAKKKWLKELFRTPEGIDAEYIELQNSYQKFKKKNRKIQSRTPIETFADGQLTGEWKERGSKNQAGSVFVTAYDQDTKFLYLVSAGGHIWKGTIDGKNWTVVQDRARFHNQFLDIVTDTFGTKRILAAISNQPHYSDDDGATWIPSEGFVAQGGANLRDVFTTEDSLQITYFLGKQNSSQKVTLYQSKNHGISYEPIHTFLSSDPRNLSLSIAKNSNEVFVLEKFTNISSRLFKMNDDHTNLELIESATPFSFEASNGCMVSVHDGNLTHLYALNQSSGVTTVFHSIDLGLSWEEKSILPTNPWNVGLFVSADNPDFLMYGEVECYRSYDGGDTWELINGWAEYYGDVINKLHADMMYFSDYTDKDTDEYFMLISNHGGISKMNTYDQEPLNISLTGLNVSQYYSVRTHPITEDFVYAGSQDQGFQRGQDKDGDILNLDQAISGDYGHIIFTENEHLWTVYPGGAVSFWPNPKNGPITGYFELISNDESVWIPPLVTIPDNEFDQILMAGGNAKGGDGSHIILLVVNNEQIFAEQFEFDFKAASGGTVSAIAAADKFMEKIYVATSNGQFFYSEDSGDTFTKTTTVNTPHYLYGSVIIPSKLNPEKIYTAGNGYNGVPVLRSTDGGKTFEPFGDGLPNTTVLGMVMNEDESLLFAATSSGPYVCILGEHKWYDLMGDYAPDVTYWSVELINNGQTARFGTYGRGIFDFNIDYFVGIEENDKITDNEEINLFPNPVVDMLTINWKGQEIKDAAIFDVNGTFVQKITNLKDNSTISLSHLQKGTYFVRYNSDNTIKSKTIIKI